MVASVRVVGDGSFERFARDLRRAGQGGLLREMAKAMRTEAAPLTDEIKQSALRISSRGARGGASARAVRAAYLLRRRKRLTDRAKLLAHRRSGLRAAVSRTVQFQVRTGASTASVRIRSNPSRMPPGQQALPGHMNTGHWRHPVFGDHDVWVTQHVGAEWFDLPARRGGPKVRDRVSSVVQRYIAKSVSG